jgi:ABC-2 type transport system ATP-binding protein
VTALVAAGVRVRGFSAEAATLEERFVELTGEGFDVAG